MVPWINNLYIYTPASTVFEENYNLYQDLHRSSLSFLTPVTSRKPLLSE